MGHSVATPPAAATQIQQFTAGGHILGFGVGQVYLASGSHALQVQFVGALPVSPQSDSAGGEGQQQKAPALVEVRYPGLWPGVDLSYRAASGGIAESVWRVAPGADVAQVRLRYNRPLALNPDGSLAIRFETGVLNESAPVAWQEIDGQRRPISVAFTLIGGHDLGISLGQHDPAQPVTIDPTLTWNTFLGNEYVNYGYALAIDGSSSIYVTGTSAGSWGSPVRPYASGRYDAFIAKLDASGALLWNTFLGGKGDDSGYGLAVDGNGHVYVIGNSEDGWGNPVRPNAKGTKDAFVAQLDARSGVLLWNTFLGGAGSDFGWSLAIDGSDHVYVTGHSNAGWGNPVRAFSAYVNASGHPMADAFVAQLDARSGVLLWNTFLGGAASEWARAATDSGSGVALDNKGHVYVVGESGSNWGSPVRRHNAGEADAFVAQVDAGSGALLWNTFLGGAAADYGARLVVDSNDHIYVTGSSLGSWGKPVHPKSSYQDTFIAQLDARSGVLLWNTFLGSNESLFSGRGVALDGSGHVFVAGTSDAGWGNPVRPYADNEDAFVAQLDARSGVLLWNTFLGGAGYSSSANNSGRDYGGSLAVDGSGHVYVAGSSSSSWGTPLLPYTRGTPNYSYPPDIFVAKLSATPTNNSATLAVTRTGTGTITSTPAGIDCGVTCSATFSSGKTVTLKFSPGAGYTFSGWGGACSGSGACTVKMNGDQAVTAQFVTAGDAKHLLKVGKVNTGLVTSEPGGIACGGRQTACSALFSSVILTAYPNPGYFVKAWVGCPGSTGATCSHTLTRPTTIKAIFVKLPKFKLKVAKTKGGLITSSPSGLQCGFNARTCNASFASGTEVQLTATPKPGAAFIGWTGACSGTGDCRVTMDGSKGVGAAFQ